MYAQLMRFNSNIIRSGDHACQSLLHIKKKAQDDDNDDADCYIKTVCTLVHTQCSVCAYLLKKHLVEWTSFMLCMNITTSRHLMAK